MKLLFGVIIMILMIYSINCQKTIFNKIITNGVNLPYSYLYIWHNNQNYQHFKPMKTIISLS